jgi:SNF2 family DNA or RNA helicase
VPFPDAALLNPAQREAASLRIKALPDIRDFPDLAWFNSAPCEMHRPAPHPLCRRCGIIPRKHQRVGAAWLYLGLPGELLSDQFGSGKTAQVLMALAMCKESGELSYDNRCVILCRPAALHDPWANEIARLTPGLDVIIADGSPKQREKLYRGKWEVAVVSSRTFSPSGGTQRPRPGDVAILLGCPAGILVYDDVDEMRSPKTRTHKAVKKLAAQCTRVIAVHATPLQKRLMELHSFTVPLGGEDRLGPEWRVRQRYVTSTRKWITVPDRKDPSGRRRSRRAITVDTGVTSNPERIAEFRRLIAPMVLRRTAADFDDVELPAIQVNPVFLDLLPRQRARYEELRQGVLRRLRASGEEITYSAAAAAFTRGWQICAGLAGLDDGAEAPGSSVKLDWVMDALTGDLAEEKAVCFVYHRGNVRALSARLSEAGIRHVLLWSEMTDKRKRAERLRLFRDDPGYRVLVGTTTIEASLNLQAARHLIAVDTILNPARMQQLVGRVRRQGSAFGMVFFHHLLALDTQEDGYLPLLRREQGVSDVVWNERDDVFRALSPAQLMRMVAYGSVNGRIAA